MTSHVCLPLGYDQNCLGFVALRRQVLEFHAGLPEIHYVTPITQHFVQHKPLFVVGHAMSLV